MLTQANGHSVRWCRRGTTAGAWAFKAAALNRPDVAEPEVILPSTACSTLPAAGLIAGCKLRFADVSLRDALPTLETIKATVTENTVAVLFIHMFGNTTDLDEIQAFLKARNIWLIEDAAQAFGGHTPVGKALGSVGEMTLHGFTDFKILESGGGALMVRDAACEPFVAQAVRQLPWPIAIPRDLYARYDRSFQAIYNGLVELARISSGIMTKLGSGADIYPPFAESANKLPDGRRINIRPTAPQFSSAFESIILSYTDWFMQCEPPTMRLAYERRKLEESIAHRLLIAELYRKLLPPEKGEVISHPEESGNCWMYSILLNERHSQDEIISKIRRRGYQATDLYWPLDTVLGDIDLCPNALELGQRVVNLPVDKSVNEEAAREIVKIIVG